MESLEIRLFCIYTMSTEEGQSSAVVVKEEEVKMEEVKLEDKTETSETPKQEVEVPKEEEKVKKAPSEMDLSEMIKDIIASEKKDIQMIPKVEALLLKLSIVDKKHLDNIEIFFNQIMQDKKIDMKDLPALMSLVQELFILYESLKAKASSFDIGAILRVLIELLLKYKKDLFQDVTEEQKTAILASLDMVLELSTQLIELKDTQKKLKGWFSFLPCVSA
jgi:hypothetical protein